MYARVATFLNYQDTAPRRRNRDERFLPALRRQPGFIAGYWLDSADGKRIAIHIFESKQAFEAGDAAAHAVPLLPGISGEQLESPDSVELFEVTQVDQPIPS
jgi:hypothetical protein